MQYSFKQLAEQKHFIIAIICIILLFSFKNIVLFCNDAYEWWNRQSFVNQATGIIPIQNTPLKVPEKYKTLDAQNQYCHTFDNAVDSTIVNASYVYERGDSKRVGIYCGLVLDQAGLVPYQLLKNGKAKYYLNHYSVLIGAAPQIP